MMKVNKLIDGLFFVVLGILIISVILGLPLMLLWNWTIPSLFGLSTISFWQAVSLNIISGILFRGSTPKD